MLAEKWSRIGVAGGLLFSIAATSLVARAQSDNRVAAEDLFRQARKLLEEGRYAEACEKLAASERLDQAPGTLLNLANCYEKVGRTASAWETYREALSAARRAGQAERERIARHEAAALESKLSRLTIQVVHGAAGSPVTVTRDGVAVVSDLWGVAVAVDPGDHVLTATAPGFKPWTTTVHVEPSLSETVSVPDLEPAPAPAPEVAPPAAHAVPENQSPREAAPETRATQSSWGAQKTLAVIVAGVGLAGGAVAIVELVDYLNQKSQSNALCPGSCSDIPTHTQAVTLLNSAEWHETIAIAAGAIGGAALLGATVLWATAGTAPSSSSALRLAPFLSPQSAGMRVAGVW